MRPVRIRASGFGTFRDPVDVDLADVDFFALVGPTGAGKSTVIDAMCFALYGSVPRYDDNRAVAPAISLGALEAKVALTFLVGGVTYEVTRVARRTASGGATTKEARLERVEPDGTLASLSSGAREVTPAVVRLIGLPFEHFTKCVVLPQGEFAQFLHATPSDRQELLVRLLNLGLYTTVGQRARQLASEAKARIDADERRLGALAHATPDVLAAAAARATAIDALRAAIDAHKPVDEALARQIHEHEGIVRAAREAIAALAELAVPDDVRTAHDRLTDARIRARAAVDAVAAAEAAAATSREVAEALPEPAALHAAIEARADLETCAADLVTAATVSERAHQTVTAAAATLEIAGREEQEAESAFETARHIHLPHELTRALVVGETCPVCEQVVTRVPARVADSELEAARARFEESRRAATRARDAHATADKALGAADAGRRQLEQQHATLVARAASFPDDDLDALLTSARDARAALERTSVQERDARDKERSARDQVTTLERVLQRAEMRFAEQREALARTSLEPPPRTDDLVTDWEALATWADEERPRRTEAAANATTSVENTRAERRSAFAQLAEQAHPLDVEGRDLSALAEAAVAASTGAHRDVADLQRALDETDSLRATIATTRTEQVLAEELGRRLRSSGFERWLVTEALDTLVADATHTLQSLTAGAYSLAHDPESADLVVVDHQNADERRPVRTLSGGETFQASLALALALSKRLADFAADGAARLESIFLDEGFGSLDPDTLETVASTIETLGTGGRMVGIVTHVRELAERVPVRFEVRKVGSTSTVTRVDA